MMFKITYFIWQQKTIGHKFIINWEEPLQSANDDAKNVLFGEVVHQWIPIKYALPHFNYVQIVVPQSHAVPEK